jgi:signal transduction histidine kinase
MAQFRKTGEARILNKRLELAAIRRDGTEFPIELSVTQLHFPRELQFCAFIRDITERKRAAEDRQRLNDDLERRVRDRTVSLQDAMKELDTFAYTIAHDLRAPLRTMQGFSELLLQDQTSVLSEEGRDLARRIAGGAQRMDHLTRDLLAYARLSRTEIPIQKVDLTSVVDEGLAQMREELDSRKAQVKVDRPLPMVLGHALTLSQAITNLIGNASKFVASGVEPRVHVRAERRNGLVRLWVEDNGIGIDSNHLGRLFKPFERLQLQESYPGTGIGLAIVRRAMERMNGQAGVESELGRGSRFWIDLPQG